MKKLIASLFVSIVVLCWFTVAATIPVTDLSWPTSCNSNETVEYKFYLTSNGLSRKPYDVFWNTVDSLVWWWNNGSSINIWKHGVISSCNTWNRISNVVSAGDSNWALIFLNADNCVFNIPNYTKVSNPTAIDAQIHYTIWYRLIYNEWANTMTSRLYHRDYWVDNWTCYPAWNSVSNSDNCSEVTVKYWSQKYHTWECLNYRVFRCGDGLVNSPYWTTYDNWQFTEQCDPNDPTHAWRWNWWCSASCQPINNTQPPVCNTAYSWTHYVNNPIYPNWLNAWMNLCSIWTVSNFTNRWNWYGHVWHYSWTCSNSAGSINCQANQQRCWDWLVNGNEACDPNDQTHSGWNNNGYSCNASCQLVPPPTQNPQCNTAYSWTHYVNDPAYPNWLTESMNLCSIWTVSNLTHRWSWIWHVWHYGWTCSNSAGSINCQANQQRCWDWLKNGNEACDPNDSTHSWRWNGWCSPSCQPINVQNPQCNSQYNWQTQYTPNSNPRLNNTMNLCTIWTLSNFNYSWTPRLFTWNCSAGENTVNCSANQQWCWDSQLNGSEQCDYNDPTHAWRGDWWCSKLCQPIINPGSPVPYLLKQQKTWGMANFTTNQINVEIWETITYKVNFGNSGTVAATWEVWDILPPCVNYLTSSIHLPAWVTYNWPTVWPVNAWNQTMVKYSNFRLQPGQWGYMLVQAQVRWTWMNWMTSCQNTYSYLNTWYFKFVWWNTLSSQVIAIRPQAPQLPHLTINKELLTAWDMTAWSTVVYKITLTNDWNATYHNAYILDILPNAIQYQTSSIQNITNYLFEEGTTWNNDYFIRYYNFDLTAGHSAIVYLTWVLKQWFNFNQTVNCAFTSWAYDCEEFPLTPVPFVQKYQKIGNDNNPNSNGWTTHTLNIELLQYISYRIDFGNSWNKAATGEVRDILPQCVQYINAYLVGANWNWPTYYPNVHTVRFKNIPLAAWQRAHMMVIWKIKQEDGCQNVYSYLNTWEFHFINKPWQNSTVLAERPNTTDVEITKTVDKNKVKSWDIVTYTITYKNMWPEILQSYTIVDYWPSEQLDFAWVIEPTTPTPIWEWNNIIKWHFNTPLGVGEQRQIIIRWIVR